MPSILTPFADNAALMEAVREVLDKHFTLDDIKTELTNEEMGARVRSRIEGVKKLDAAFKEIEGYKTSAIRAKTENPGR